ncbi:formimidoylglutamase [Cetobacterium sp. 8H]|uniref:formimidoylglutamase n=1 Tax=Cetobacterium sp. 8H TaxID=2759681 RepID=UPI00163D0CC1|nr:formimidoylglutamase [Cetobacterium sp. 8H]MBC2850461.1 formimidoylglutamase [Cetobacterium sp. 8H]
MYWTGRVDGEEQDVLRIHQAIKIMSFEDLLNEDSKEKKICFVSFNSDEGVRRNSGRLGAKEGWIHVKKALSGFPIFIEDLKFYDLKDPIEVIGHDLESAHEKLSHMVSSLKSKNYLVVVLGGGHDIAFGTYNGVLDFALTQEEKPKIGIINFDAHFDMREYTNGRNSGTMFLQIADNCQEKGLNFDYNVFGIQKFSNTKRLFDTADRLDVKYYFAEEIRTIPMDEIYSILKRNDYIHLTLCTDVFHITSAPGVSAPQTFGVNPRNALPLLKTIAKYSKNLTIDVAEINPTYDYDDRTSRLMANIIYELILCHFE